VKLEIERVQIGGEDADIALAEIGDELRRVRQFGKRKNGAGAVPKASFTALMPFSISSLASATDFFARLTCDQV
jgi:hypothetical protein